MSKPTPAAIAVSATLKDMRLAIDELSRATLTTDGQLATERARSSRLSTTLMELSREMEATQRRMGDLLAYGRAIRALEAKPGNLALQSEVQRLRAVVARMARAMVGGDDK